MTFRRAWLAPALAALTLTATACGGPDNGGDIVPSTGSDGQQTPTTVPNGPGTPTAGSDATTGPGTSSTATGAAPAPGSNDTPQSQDEQQSGSGDTPATP